MADQFNCADCGHPHLATANEGTVRVMPTCSVTDCLCTAFRFGSVKQVAKHPDHRKLEESHMRLEEDNALLRSNVDELTRRAAGALAHLHYLTGILDGFSLAGAGDDPLDVRVQRLGNLAEELMSKTREARPLAQAVKTIAHSGRLSYSEDAVCNAADKLVDVLAEPVYEFTDADRAAL